MKQPFEIKFDFPVAESDLKVSLKATAELHHSDPYFLVSNFYLENYNSIRDHYSILPDQEIKRIKRGQSKVWVHRDSERESLLSLEIGAAIEKMFTSDEIDKLMEETEGDT